MAERLPAQKLLPAETLALVRITDTKELVARFQDTALGRLAKDPEVSPLLGKLWGSVGTVYKNIEERVGLPLEKLLQIPQGEIALAVLPTDRGTPGLAVLMTVGEKAEDAKSLLIRADEAIRRNGSAVVSNEKISDIEVTKYDFGGRRRNQILTFQHEDTIVMTSDASIAKKLIARWTGEDKGADLASNDNYAAIMKRCHGGKKSPPQIIAYADPIGIVRSATSGNLVATAGLAVLPVIGLDGLKGIGGSIALATDEFDNVIHAHILLDSPRAGVIEALALGSGDTTPEKWVPGDTGSYMTLHWDVKKSFDIVRKLIDSFQGEGAVDGQVKRNISDRLGIEFETDLLDAMDGRVTYMTWIERPASFTSQAGILGIKLKDPAKFTETWDKLIEKFKDSLEKKAQGDLTYYQIKRPAAAPDAAVEGDRPAEEPAPRRRRRGPRMNVTPCFAIVGDYLIITEREASIAKIATTRADASLSLASKPEFKIIADEISRQLGGKKPGMITYQQPEEGMKMFYEMATSEDARKRLGTAAEGNEFLKDIEKALADHPLPPFPVIAKYLAPGGGMLTSDESGFHYTGFTLKRK